jgi:hypothetical protein
MCQKKKKDEMDEMLSKQCELQKKNKSKKEWEKNATGNKVSKQQQIDTARPPTTPARPNT